ncbi:MAG: response regulator [Aestuariivirga sp.]|nr:response regulator [Aestuariivirga sp.]
MMAQPTVMSGSFERKSLSLSAPGGRRPRLLLAEDCDPMRIVTAAMLKGMGCDVEAVVHGEQAVNSAAESRFDVIVLDIEMPVMDGITAARSIRRMGGEAAATPLMALSAFLADSVRTGDWRDTFDIALPKPANRNELHEAVKAALNREPAESVRPAETLPPLLDEPRLSEIRRAITPSDWRQISDGACRDIESCIGELEHVHCGPRDGAMLASAATLATLGRSFAARRLDWAAQKFQRACSEAARHEALAVLISSARDTVQILRS